MKPVSTELNIDFHAGDVLHLWFRPRNAQHENGVRIHRDDAQPVTLRSGASDDPVFHAWTAPADGRYRVAWDAADCEMSVAYAYRPDTVRERGIEVLWTSEAARLSPSGPRFHFCPPFGWMNDPNGLCQAGDTVHLFYQHYPHRQRWGSMHWGHTISTDMLRWTHLPVFLFPDDGRVRRHELVGGAFSGTALPLADGRGLRVFYTDRADERLPEWEWQMTAVSADGVVAGAATPIIDARPQGRQLQPDFRDPYVFKGPDDELKLLLGSRDDAGSAVLLYTTADPTGASGWRFVDVIHRDARFGTGPAECPCMIALDGAGQGLWVLIYGLLKSRDPATGRRNLTTAIVGRFDGRRFEPVVTQELDVGTDCYAFQAYPSPHGPRGLAWAANWRDVRRTEGNFPTAMTLPRALVWRDGALATPPIPETRTLRQAVLADEASVFADGIALDDGTAELQLHWQRPGVPFRLDFEHPELALALSYDGSELRLHYATPDGAEHPRYGTAPVSLASVQVFVDVGVIEVYADDGRWCITKRLASEQGVRSVRLATDAAALADVCAWRVGLD